MDTPRAYTAAENAAAIMEGLCEPMNDPSLLNVIAAMDAMTPRELCVFLEHQPEAAAMLRQVLTLFASIGRSAQSLLDRIGESG
jgi:hypothetical protein